MTDKQKSEQGAIELKEDALDDASGGMKSGSDNVTLENWAVKAPAPGASKIQEKKLDGP